MLLLSISGIDPTRPISIAGNQTTISIGSTRVDAFAQGVGLPLRQNRQYRFSFGRARLQIGDVRLGQGDAAERRALLRSPDMDEHAGPTPLFAIRGIGDKQSAPV